MKKSFNRGILNDSDMKSVGNKIIYFAIIAILVLIYSRIIANIERENKVNEE